VRTDRLIRDLFVGTLSLPLLGCAPIITTVDRAAESGALADQLGIPVDEVRFVSRCGYIEVQGGISSGKITGGVCAIAKGSFYIRPLDKDTEQSKFRYLFVLKTIHSVSLNTNLVFPPQVQLHADDDVIAVYMRHDDGHGVDSELTKRVFALLKEANYPEVPSDGHIWVDTGHTPFIPMIAPRR
jgi:hypothetical protein